MKVGIYLKHNYYWPHFLPIVRELQNRNAKVFIGFSEQPSKEIIQEVAEFETVESNTNSKFNIKQWCNYFNQVDVSWLFFGNSEHDLDELSDKIKTALVQHGIGPKSVYYAVSDSPIEYRFVESSYRLSKLKSLFPNKKFVEVGYSKLDPIINSQISKKEFNNFDPNKKTLLYAPTFYPSTVENIPDEWPQDFKKFNIIIKPHGFSYSKEKYSAQRRKFKEWDRYDNVHLVNEGEQNLLPYLFTADVMISEYSSALFEFAALNKPVVICEFVKLRWSYKGIFNFRFKQRVDSDFERFKSIGTAVISYEELLNAVDESIGEGDKHINKELINEIAGVVDGKASFRICDFIYQEN